jgi:hypothetical protein
VFEGCCEADGSLDASLRCDRSDPVDDANDDEGTGEATGRRMRSGEVYGTLPENVRAPAADSLTMGDWRADGTPWREEANDDGAAAAEDNDDDDNDNDAGLVGR